MLQGKVRESISKSQSKALRKDGYLIANIYGKGVANIHCAFKENDFIRFLKSKSTLTFKVELDGKSYEVAVKEYQKDVVTGRILHVDLLLAQNGVKSRYKVPVKAHGSPVGLKNKGVLLISKKTLNVFATPENLPACFDLSVDALDIGDSILVRDIKTSDEVKILDRPSVAVLGVIKAK